MAVFTLEVVCGTDAMGVNSAEERDLALATILYRLAGTISEHGLLEGKSVSLIDEHGNKVGHAKLSEHHFLRRFLRDDSGATARRAKS